MPKTWDQHQRPGTVPGTCRHNMGVDPKNDCGKPAIWHIRYQGESLMVLACHEHLGRALRPDVIDGEKLGEDLPTVALHEVGPKCLVDSVIPTWWVDDLNMCVDEEDGVRLGVIGYSDVPWQCSVCGELDSMSHWRSNSDGSVRHDPFGINHAPFPGSPLAADLAEFYQGVKLQ